MRPDEFFSLFRPDAGDSHHFFQNEMVLEVMFWIVVVLLALILLRIRTTFFTRLESYAKKLSVRRGKAVVVVIFLALFLRAAVLPVIPIPVPWVHDEYSYLLQAKTFASGKITNPTPPGWEHFEAFHVNMWPTYQSMYPPAQALFLASAEVVHLNPWWGVWLSVGLMCGAVCWMLQGWLPPYWAFLGGLFCVLRFSLFSYWSNSYFGGAVAAMGGALVFGALARIRRHPKMRYGLLFALGLALLANSRAYEGFVCSLPALIALALWFFPAWKRGQVRISVLAPAMCLLLLVGGLMGYYNWRVTGHALSAPYIVNQQQYHVTKPFLWQARYPIPEYRHQVMRTFYLFHELPGYLNRAHPGFYQEVAAERISVYYDFYVWPLIIPLVLAVWTMMKSRKMRILPLTMFLLLAGLLIEQWPPEAHYGAPLLAVMLAILVYGLRLIRTWRPKRLALGAMLVRSIVIAGFAQAVLATVSLALDPYALQDKYGVTGEQLERARLEAQLERIPGQHLIFVHCHPRDTGSIFWIYNDPNPATSRIIWAHDMGDIENQQLIRLYPNRRLWIVDKVKALNILTPYPGSFGDSAAFLQAAVHSGEIHE